VGCRHHLYLFVEYGKYVRERACEPWELEETCALDVADRGGVTHAELGRVLGVQKQMAQRIEARAMRKLAPVLPVTLDDCEPEPGHHKTYLPPAVPRQGELGAGDVDAGFRKVVPREHRRISEALLTEDW
jgi:hypothetical protein